MSHSPSAGTKFKLSAGVPSSFDATGYGALSYTIVGEVDDVGEFGAEWANYNHNPLAKRGTQKAKTTRDPGSFTLTLALDKSDAGQILMKSARDSTALHAAQVEMPNGDKYYCQVLVNSFKVGGLNAAGKTIATASCAVSTSPTDVDWVESLAA